MMTIGSSQERETTEIGGSVAGRVSHETGGYLAAGMHDNEAPPQRTPRL